MSIVLSYILYNGLDFYKHAYHAAWLEWNATILDYNKVAVSGNREHDIVMRAVVRLWFNPSMCLGCKSVSGLGLIYDTFTHCNTIYATLR